MLFYYNNSYLIQMKASSVPKKPKITPVVLVDESEGLNNTVIISKMVNNHKDNQSIKPSNVFAGGFKYRPQQPKNNANTSNLSTPQIDKLTVYDEFGIINDSIGKKKYRDDKRNKDQSRQAQKQSFLQDSAKPISSSNPWKKESMNNNFVDPSYYQISKLKERQQSAIHVKSSLEVINLQNIQAKLEAHRQTLKPIEEQYNILKGKSIVEPQYKEKLRFNIDAEREFRESQPTRVYQLIKETQERGEKPKEEQILQQMWEQRKKKDPKLAEYDFKYQQYLVEKEAKKLIGTAVKDSLFSWDKYAKKEQLEKRKTAKQHKSKEKSYGQAVEQKVIDKNRSNLSPSKQTEEPTEELTNIEQKIASKDDKFIGKYIMAAIDVDKRGMISKEELVYYLSSNDHLIKGYHIDLKWLHTDLDNFQTKRKAVLNQQEVVQFLATLDSLHHPQMVLKQLPKGRKEPQVSLTTPAAQSGKVYSTYFKQHLVKFQRVFSMLDFSDDKIIKREDFIQNIFIDADCLKVLDRNAIDFHLIGKNITFRQILAFILQDYRKEKSEKLKKSKQYITFQRFSEYFQVPQSLDLSLIDRSHRDKLSRGAGSTEIEMFDIQQDYLIILKDIFDTIPRIYQNYVIINDFISISEKDPQVLAISDELCRIQSVETKLPVETIKSTLIRLRKETDEYGTWENIKTYFSRRGRPLDWDFDLIQKKKELRVEKLKERANIVKNTSVMQGDFSSSRPVFELSSKLRSQKKQTSVQKFTIPLPFNITDQRKRKDEVSAKKLTSQDLEIEELKKKFKAKPVNAQILAPKPDLIHGKLNKSVQKSSVYKYQNYENDRIERVLKQARQKFEAEEQMKEIKRIAEVKANTVKIDMKTKLQDVVKEQKKNTEKTKPKPTVPQVNPNLYPQDPKEEAKKKLQKYKVKLQKQEQAAQVREDLKKEIKQKAKERNKQIVQTAKQKKKRDEQQQKELAKLQDNSFRPQIKKYNTKEQDKEAMKRAKEQRQRKKMQEQQVILQQLQKKKKEKLSYVKLQNKLQLQGLQDQEILSKLEEVDLEDLLIDEGDQASFRKQFQIKGKTRKEVKQRFNGQAGRERAAMQAEEKRLADQKREFKEQKQQKVVKEKIEQAKQLKKQMVSTMNDDNNFHRSNALRRYRAIMQGKTPNSQYDADSKMGDPKRKEI